MPRISPCVRGQLLYSLSSIKNRGPYNWPRYASQSSHSQSAASEPKTDASDPPAPRAGDSLMIRQENSSEALVNHQPDYHAPIDHGTS